MALNYTKRCIRCRQKMRNDGTTDNPAWHCQNPKCVRYYVLPKAEEPKQEETTEVDEVITE